MSNFPDAHKVYDLAAVFRERVIEQGRSFLWPDQEIWSEENIKHLLGVETRLYDEGDRSIPEVADAFRDEPTEILMMAADVQAACHFFWASTEHSLRRLVSAFTDQPGLPAVDQETWQLLEEQASVAVPASWTTYKHTSLTWHMSAAFTIATLRANRNSPRDTSTIENDLLEMNRPGVWYHHVWSIAHVLYPDQIPALPAENLRERVIKRYKDEAQVDTSQGEFTQLQEIREYLKPQVDGEYFDFHHPSIFLDWENRKDFIRRWAEYERGGPIPRDIKNQILADGASGNEEPNSLIPESVSHTVREKFQVYEIARLFQSRAIDQGRSLLWPDQEVWTPEVIERFLQDFSANVASKDRSWRESFRVQTATSDPRTMMLLADSYAFIMQFASTDDYRGETKARILNEFASWVEEAPDPETFSRVLEGFNVGIGSPGTAFIAAISHQISYIPLFVTNLSADLGQDLQTVADKSVEQAKTERGFKKTTVPARNIVLHLLDPENFERIASRAHKIQIVDSFESQLEELSLGSDDLDENLRTVRSHLAGRYFPRDFDFYDAEVLPYWDGDQVLDPEEPLETTVLPTIADLAAATFLDEPHLRDIENLLSSKKQLIFEGPPGSGKTFVAEKFARYFTRQPLSGERNDRVELVQFHQSYSYEDFVEGIRPETKDGQLHYNVKPGIFREFADKAWKDLENNYVLIIDEINRGNVSRILGELMLLLEYREEKARLPYSQEYLEIPPNLYIIGTMNSADRSLSQIDYALRRRFYFVRFLSVENGEAKVLSKWLDSQNLEPDKRHRILRTFIELNAQLRSHLDTDDLQIGHSYFMDANIGNEDFRKQVWKYAVIPLIREYLYHHRDRDELLQSYELQRLISIVQPIADETGESTEHLISESPGEMQE